MADSILGINIIGNKIRDENTFIIPYSLRVYKDNFFVVDRLSQKLYKYDLDGQNGKIIVNSGSERGQLCFPYDILIRDDMLYVADGGNYRIQAFDLSGKYLFEFGGFGSKENEFGNGNIFNGDGRSSNPQSLFLDNDGNINAIDIFLNCIKVFSPSGEYIKNYEFHDMGSYGTCTIDESGFYYISDVKNHMLKCFDKELSLKWQIGGLGNEAGKFNCLWKVLIYNNLIYVGDIYNHRIQIFNKKGEYISQFGKNGSGDYEFDYIFGFDFGVDGKMYLTDTWNHRIKIYDRDFTCLKIFGHIQEDIVLRPSAVRFSNDEETFFVADYLNHNIAQFDKNGKLVKRIGKLGNKNGEFKYPNDIFISEDNILFVSDSKNGRIQIFDYAGNFKGKFPSEEDCINIIPSGVAVYENEIYVADILNSRIYEFDKCSLRYKGTISEKGNEFGNVNSLYKTEFIRLDVYNNYLIIADASNNRIQIYDMNIKKFIRECSNNYYIPVRARIIHEDKMLVVNRKIHNVQIDYNSGKKEVIGTGLGNSESQMIAPWDADYSIKNNLLVILDSLNNRIKLVSIKL